MIIPQQDDKLEKIQVLVNFLFAAKYQSILFPGGESLISCLNSLGFKYSIDQRENKLMVATKISLRYFAREDATEEEKKFFNICLEEFLFSTVVDNYLIQCQPIDYIPSEHLMKILVYIEVKKNNDLHLFKTLREQVEQIEFEKEQNEEK